MRGDIALGRFTEGYAGVDFRHQTGPRSAPILDGVDALRQFGTGSASRLPCIRQRDGRIRAQAQVSPLARHLIAQHPTARAVHRDVEDQATHTADMVGATAPEGGDLGRTQFLARFAGDHGCTSADAGHG